MRKSIQQAVLLCTCLILLPGLLLAQEEAPKVPAEYNGGLKMDLGNDGNKYIRFIMWHQIWATTNNLEPSNANSDASFVINDVNFSLRRSRFLAYAQISPRFLILTHFGLNNLNWANLTSLGNNGDGPQLFLHDAWGEVKVNDNVYVGAGLHYWKGMTRLANQSTLNFMTLDATRPFAHWHSLGITDQFARHLGVYAKGDIGQLEYRVAVNNPLTPSNSLGFGQHFGDLSSNYVYNGSEIPDGNGDPIGGTLVEGYFKYDFFDKESMKLPYYVGTYMGQKKLLSVGAGFFAHPNAMYDTVRNEHRNAIHFAGDIFLDVPAKGGAVNAYASYQRFDYGDNYVSRWVGTGNHFYGHFGYYIKNLNIMPYVSGQFAQYDGMRDDPSALNVGLNYYINGHFAKVTLEYFGVYNDIRESVIDSQGNRLNKQQLRLQLHVFL